MAKKTEGGLRTLMVAKSYIFRVIVRHCEAETLGILLGSILIYFFFSEPVYYALYSLAHAIVTHLYSNQRGNFFYPIPVPIYFIILIKMSHLIVNSYRSLL